MGEPKIGVDRGQPGGDFTSTRVERMPPSATFGDDEMEVLRSLAYSHAGHPRGAVLRKVIDFIKRAMRPSCLVSFDDTMTTEAREVNHQAMMDLVSNNIATFFTPPPFATRNYVSAEPGLIPAGSAEHLDENNRVRACDPSVVIRDKLAGYYSTSGLCEKLTGEPPISLQQAPTNAETFLFPASDLTSCVGPFGSSNDAVVPDFKDYRPVASEPPRELVLMDGRVVTSDPFDTGWVFDSVKVYPPDPEPEPPAQSWRDRPPLF